MLRLIATVSFSRLSATDDHQLFNDGPSKSTSATHEVVGRTIVIIVP